MDAVVSYFMSKDIVFQVNPDIVVTWVFMFLLFQALIGIRKSLDALREELIVATTRLTHLEKRQDEMHEENIIRYGRRKGD